MNAAQQLASYVQARIVQLTGGPENTARAALAKLRRGIGKAPGALPQLFEWTLDGLPEGQYSRDGTPTPGEWAVYTALCLFALHQQGKNLRQQPMHRDGMGLGKAVRGLVATPEDQPRIKRRFDAAATAQSPAEFAHHLRGLMQLLRGSDIPLDYAALTQDLYYLQFEGSRDGVRLRWGQDFYSFKAEKDSETEENDQTENGGE